MLENHSIAPARTPRFRPLAILCLSAGLALGLGAGFAAATPALAAQAAAADGPVAAAAPATPGADTLSAVTTDARVSIGAARAALARVGELTADIEATGLDLGDGSTAIDTVPLLEATARMADLDVMPALLLPDLTDDVVAATRAVEDRTTALRARLDAAIEKREAAEAKAKAAREAKRKAEAAAKAAAAANTVEGAKATARSLMSSEYGWGGDQFSCLDSLWTKESGWNYQAYNASSGATGIPQSLPGSKMASAGADWQTNATTQIRWGLQYIASAYGTPCSAWGHSQATDWY